MSQLKLFSVSGGGRTEQKSCDVERSNLDRVDVRSLVVKGHWWAQEFCEKFDKEKL